MNINIPTQLEIHRIAFLTMHGWELDQNIKWKKDGFIINVGTDYRGRPLTDDKFDLDEAYYAQKDKLDEK